MANDTSKVILEYFLKLIIYAIGGTIGAFIFIEDYSKIEGVKFFLLAIAAFLFFLIYLLPKAESNKKRYQILLIAIIMAILVVLLGSTVYDNLDNLYKNTNRFARNVIVFILINYLMLYSLDKIFEILKKYVKSK